MARSIGGPLVPGPRVRGMGSAGVSLSSLPVNTVAPVVSGTRGGTLSVTTGTWSGVPAPVFTYQWQAAATVGGGGAFANISGATASTFDDSGTSPITSPYDVRVIVTATNSVGAPTATSNTLSAWTPLSLGASLKLWLDEREQVGSPIDSWGDQSPTGTQDFTASLTARPSTGRTINGFAAPDFDGTNDQMGSTKLLSDIVSGNTVWIQAVVILDAAATVITGPTYFTGHGIIGNVGGYVSLGFGTIGGVIKAYMGAFGSVAGAAALDTVTAGTRLVEGRLQSGTLGVRVDAAAETTQAAAAGTIGVTTGALLLGLSNSAGAAFFNGAVGQVLACNAVPSAADIGNSRRYATAKYGVAA